MYSFQHEERTGNRPFWSDYDLVVLELMLMMAEKIL